MQQIVKRYYGYDIDPDYNYVDENGIKFFPTSIQIPDSFCDIF